MKVIEDDDQIKESMTHARAHTNTERRETRAKSKRIDRR